MSCVNIVLMKKEYIQEEVAAVKRRGISFSEIKSYKLYDRWKP